MHFTQCPVLMFHSAIAFLPEGPTTQDSMGKGEERGGSANCCSCWRCYVRLFCRLKSSFLFLYIVRFLLKRAALPIYILVSLSRGSYIAETPHVTLEVYSTGWCLLMSLDFHSSLLKTLINQLQKNSESVLAIFCYAVVKAK